MDVTPLISRDAQLVQGYGPGFIRISGQTYNTPVVVYPAETTPWNGAYSDLFLIDPARVDVLLIGTGTVLSPVTSDVRAALRRAGIALEVMDTGAACRTFNVLLAEGRKVAAALIPPAAPEFG